MGATVSQHSSETIPTIGHVVNGQNLSVADGTLPVYDPATGAIVAETAIAPAATLIAVSRADERPPPR